MREIARAVVKAGEDPVKYLLGLKFVDAIKRVLQEPGTEIKAGPDRVLNAQSNTAAEARRFF